MTVNELLQKLILGEITLSQGLMLCKVMFKNVLSEDTNNWIDRELDHYEDADTIPDYRILDCELKARISGYYIRTRFETLDTTVINKQLKKGDKPYASPNKMLVRQGLESIEQSLLGTGSMVQMELHQEQINLLLDYYSLPPGCQVEKIYQECRIEQLRAIVPAVRNRLIDILEKEVVSTASGIKETINACNKKLFISYGWEDDEHREWVKALADRLSEFFEVKIDAKVPYGEELNVFMEQMITNSDRVLLILTPTYKSKADSRQNGVGYESVLISTELYRNQGTHKFIPIIRKGGLKESYPIYLGTRKGLDMINDEMFESLFAELVEDIKKH